ncbi:MAG: glycogen synthase, partial [Deltaproteobacteria bacterium]|nr:glycogen synthase [Deltaproteobacteria bacterium]
NFLKSGLVYSDVITTVSETYSREIQTPEHGWGLEGVLKNRKDDLYGILNGVDYNEWDPGADLLIPERYSIDDLTGKAACKKELLKEFGLKLKNGTPLIGIVSRLAGQKGFDILSEAMPELMRLNLGMVIIGMGDRKYRVLIEELAKRYSKKLSVKIVFDKRLSHLVEAGSDIFLMPSKYEPCGLNQIYSLKYGTVPVVRATGGLDDTVKEFRDGEGNGFKFRDYTAEALVGKVREALSVFKDRPAWETLMRNGMKEDLSWENSAASYIGLYERCLKAKQQSLKNIQSEKSRDIKPV